MKVGIVGLESPDIEKFGQALRDRDIEIACVWDYVHSKADAFHRAFAGAVVDDVDLVADEGLDGVIISVRKGDQARYALPFIEGGVPALIYDPIGMTQADVDRVIEAVDEHRTPIVFAREVGDVSSVLHSFLELCDTGEIITHPDEPVELVYPG